MRDKQFYVYIMASGKRGTPYTGVTSDLISRVTQHKDHYFEDSFTARYNVTRLVWFEIHETAESPRSAARSRSKNGAARGRWR